MIEAMEVVSVRLPKALTVEVKALCKATKPKKKQQQLTLSEFTRLALERELANRRRSKEYSRRRRLPPAVTGETSLTTLMPDPSL